MAKADKTASIAELTESFRTSNAAVLTEYRGLTVKQLTTLRTSIREHATYTVVKNTLTRRAAAEAGVSALDGQLTGPSAIAFVTGQFLQDQSGCPFAIGDQQQARGQLLGMAEVAFEYLIQAAALQGDQALVALRFARVQAGVFDGDGEQGVVAELAQVGGGVVAVFNLGDATQGASGGAFGE